MWQESSFHTDLKLNSTIKCDPLTPDPSPTPPTLQVSSCGKWRSSESRRPSTSAWATTWPPSSHVASPWSTPTPRTSPSLTRATGWSDRPPRGRESENKLWRQQQRTNMFRCPPVPPQPCGSRHAISPSCCGQKKTEKKKTLLRTFPPRRILFFRKKKKEEKSTISLCLVVVCVLEGKSLRRACLSLPSSQILE